MSAIAERYHKVLRRVADAADIAGRDPADITVIAVTKTVGLPEVGQAIAAGAHDFGENRAQEFTGKQALFPHECWHFIGTLQTNKVKQVVGRAALIHSVDSPHLLEAIDQRAGEAGVIQPVLLQVNVSGEGSKHGMSYEEAEDCVRGACGLSGVSVRGLMTMAPLSGRPESVRWVFRECADWLGRLQSLHCDAVDLTELSMGMTNDFPVAIEEGATIVRVGRAIFGR
ncbi:MAG: YggS family pyridoxal phosphate-dependent enzyme [Coriobacteriia bacterium]|nr:YggS family pyridoxal phosphate-dependent enzyme [Coriobacteriia bacterium]